MQRIDLCVYVTLSLAAAAAHLSARHAGDPWRKARFLWLTTTAVATFVVAEIGNNPTESE
jgi:hypothetical protein